MSAEKTLIDKYKSLSTSKPKLKALSATPKFPEVYP